MAQTTATKAAPPLRVGGMAFGNGVLMRSKSYWAWARADGTITSGECPNLLAQHPRWNKPLLRSFLSLYEMLRFGVQRQKENLRQDSLRMALWAVIYLAVMFPLAALIDLPHDRDLLGHALFQFLSLGLGIWWVLGKGMGPSVWSYHGAEHKAVAAYEQGFDLTDLPAVARCSRLHRRCGTNLVAILAVLTLVYIPASDARIAYLANSAWMIVMMPVALEIFLLLNRWPDSWPARALVAPGLLLQKLVTTREPSLAQLAVAGIALREVLALEAHAAVPVAAEVRETLALEPAPVPALVPIEQ